jgi:hypothetical protein
MHHSDLLLEDIIAILSCDFIFKFKKAALIKLAEEA